MMAGRQLRGGPGRELPAAPAGSAARDLNLRELRHDAMRITRIDGSPFIIIEDLCEPGHVLVGATVGVIAAEYDLGDRNQPRECSHRHGV